MAYKNRKKQKAHVKQLHYNQGLGQIANRKKKVKKKAILMNLLRLNKK